MDGGRIIPNWQQKEMREIYESWEWKLREKLTGANDTVRRIYWESMKFGVKPIDYEAFMSEKLSDMLREIGDVKK